MCKYSIFFAEPARKTSDSCQEHQEITTDYLTTLSVKGLYMSGDISVLSYPYWYNKKFPMSRPFCLS